MRLVLVGAFGDGVLDEGMRKVSSAYLRVAQSLHDAMAVSTASFCSGRALRTVWDVEPAVIHYVTEP